MTLTEGLTMWSVGVATTVAAFSIYKQLELGWLGTMKQFFSRTLPLADAAQQFYQVARHHQRIWATAAEGVQERRSESEILMFCAHAMKLADIQWSGIHGPSKIREDIPRAQIANCSFTFWPDNITTSDGRHVYSAIRLSKKDLRRVLKRIKAGGSVGEPSEKNGEGA
jgi:hypothetical protein